jgi:hypothetical protein
MGRPSTTFSAPGLLGTWPPWFLGTWVPGLLGSWTPGHLGSWVPGLLDSWALGLLGTWPSGLLAELFRTRPFRRTRTQAKVRNSDSDVRKALAPGHLGS